MRPDLALIMFNDITIGINTNGDTPITSNQPISYGALHHFGYHFDANSGEWIKSGLPATHEDDDAEGTFEDVPAPEHVSPPEHAPLLKHVPLPVAPSQVAHSSFDINAAILDTLHSLSNDL
ncbi:hypothetical protein J1N35_044300 [Gossypium stocksii]|uniref:Uncharacterized protein n=1 Tax=Gossypium stocksii TaxID=47602 RepID=A0A9D3U8T0_9ROSI|nr:hypothetical protein J1N35_044300 [Gossypium stocksii]